MFILRHILYTLLIKCQVFFWFFGVVLGSTFLYSKKVAFTTPKDASIYATFNVIFDQNLLLWRCGELNSGLKGIMLELYHYSQLFNLIF